MRIWSQAYFTIIHSWTESLTTTSSQRNSWKSWVCTRSVQQQLSVTEKIRIVFSKFTPFTDSEWKSLLKSLLVRKTVVAKRDLISHNLVRLSETREETYLVLLRLHRNSQKTSDFLWSRSKIWIAKETAGPRNVTQVAKLGRKAMPFSLSSAFSALFAVKRPFGQTKGWFNMILLDPSKHILLTCFRIKTLM